MRDVICVNTLGLDLESLLASFFLHCLLYLNQCSGEMELWDCLLGDGGGDGNVWGD